MESRNIALTLEKAREWYNSGSSDLKEVALQAYTEEELTIPEWQNIKTFKQACEALGISDIRLNLSFSGRGNNEYDHLDAILKLDIIREALNKGWNSKLTEGTIYYPYVRCYPADKAKEAARSNGWEVKETFKADGEKYSLVGGSYVCFSDSGLGNFGWEYGGVLPDLGLLGCKSKEIAQHMSRYFAKEIFEATYAHHTGAYEGV